MSDTTKTVIERALERLGFDPTKLTITSPAAAEALAEVKAERDQKAKAAAKELFTKLIDVVTKKEEIKRQFQSADQKLDKEAQQLLARLQGQTPEPQKEETPQG